MSEHKGIASNPILHKAASRKGGLRRVKKGFAMNPKLASEAGRKGAVITNAIRSNKGTKQTQVNNGGSNSIRLADILADLI